MSCSRVAVLALTLPLLASAEAPLNPERSAQLTSYCVSAQQFLSHEALDPASVSKGSKYVSPRATVMMGQKVQAASRRLAMEGTVVLGLVVNSGGRAAHVAVLEKSDYAALDSEALSLVKDADFAPATLNGADIRSCMLLRVTFKVPIEPIRSEATWVGIEPLGLAQPEARAN